MPYMDAEYTLVGACGNYGCLDCRPLFVLAYEPDTGDIYEMEIADFHYTTVDRETYHG